MTALPAASAALTWPVKIASGKFHGLMQAKTPRPGELQLVALARRARKRQRLGEIGPRAGGVIAQEVDGLAQLRQRVGQRLAGFANGHAHQRWPILFHQIGRLVQAIGARFGTARVPLMLGAHGAGKRLVDGGAIRLDSPRRSCGAGRLDR